MIRELVLSTAWMLVGASLAATLFWVFLNTPESTIYTLAASLLLVAGMYVVVAVTMAGATKGWMDGWHRLPTGAVKRGLLAMLPLLIFVAAMWWIVGRWLTWLAAHSGEMSAWFIATLDWSDVRPLVRGLEITGEWLRWIVAPFVALTWLGDVIAGARRPYAARLLGRDGRLVRVGLVTAIAVGTLWAPVTYGLYWMPLGLPPTWVQPAVAAAKFTLMATVAAIGLSLIVRIAARPPA